MNRAAALICAALASAGLAAPAAARPITGHEAHQAALEYAELWAYGIELDIQTLASCADVGVQADVVNCNTFEWVKYKANRCQRTSRSRVVCRIHIFGPHTQGGWIHCQQPLGLKWDGDEVFGSSDEDKIICRDGNGKRYD